MELSGINYTANNTVLLLDSIGEEEEEALICRTDLTPCCRSPGRGNWFFPSGISVSGNRDNNISRTRSATSEVLLHRRNNALSPLGRYCCEVPTASSSGSDVTFCVLLSKFLSRRLECGYT